MKARCRSLVVFSLHLSFLAIAVASATAQTPTVENYRKFALTHEGDAVRGRQLFNDAKLICSNCHSVDGHGGKAGPDLFAVGDAFGRRDLVDAVLSPSATIAPGYGTVIVETRGGDIFQGTLKQTTASGVDLMAIDGKLVSIPAGDIKEQKGSAVSLMPEGLQAGLTLQEFTDVVEYLTTLKQPESTLVSEHGMPGVIPPLSKPVAIRPFFKTQFTLPRGKAEAGLTSMRQISGTDNVFLVLHQSGTIWRVVKTPSGEESSIFADFPTEVFSERGPNGLLDVAFHPQFRENRKYYLFYQIFEEGKVTSVIEEKVLDANLKADSGNPARRILKIVSVAEDHSGGCIQFGPDGFLYIVMGDTGPHNDPNGHAQNLQMLLGKVLRIDVDHEDASRPYAIPADNPFVHKPGVRPEIWAYGFRNPWRFCFDRVTGDLWLSDVGQDRVEEVDLVRRGQNYGWNVYEGFEPFSNQFRREGEKYTKPVFAYRRKYGNSITGGHVYRGDKSSSFYGTYVFGDYNSKRIFALSADHGDFKSIREIGKIPQRLVSFSEDQAGNLYAVGYEGTIYQIDFTEGRFE